MWYRIGRGILQYRIFFLSVLACLTVFFGWHAAKVQMSYDFTRAIPTDNKQYQAYQAFRQKFGEDGNLLVVGFNTDKFFTPEVFNAAAELHQSLKQVSAVTEVLSVPAAVSLVKDSAGEQLIAKKIFANKYQQQADLDSAAAVFKTLPFYQTLLYTPEYNAYLFAISVNKDTINSKARTGLVNRILIPVQQFEARTGITAHVSGLPYIRTTVANRISSEMNFFLIGSIVLSAITLFLFFRSFNATMMSLGVVLMGVVWSIGTMVLFGYKITILNALIPPLVVVIGVPNCIYFLNKYHTAYKEIGQKDKAIITMVGRMGIVTLFCNIAAA
ncbi:MAG TPA: RND transporter, partial [Chitinophagaceae bacterium]|nr:RND transporter [Chitinophagaceae bacterium]